MQTNVAYDLEQFAPRKQKTRLRVAQKPKQRRVLARLNFKWIKAVAFTAVFLALVCSVPFKLVCYKFITQIFIYQYLKGKKLN